MDDSPSAQVSRPRLAWATLLLLLTLLCVLCSCGDTASGTTTTGPAASPTSPGSTGVGTGAAVLGGPGAAFIAKYGPLAASQSDLAKGDLHFKQYPGVAQDFLIVELASYYGETPANDAASILVQAPPGQPWSENMAHTICAGFFPSDAKQVKQVTVSQQGAVVGVDVIYHSTTLAATFPANAFEDANQKPAQSGSFDAMYLYTNPNDSTQVDDCQMMLGTQQTQ